MASPGGAMKSRGGGARRRTALGVATILAAALGSSIAPPPAAGLSGSPPAHRRPAAAVSGTASGPARVRVRPRLVLVIAIDQFRADYLKRFEDLYLPARTSAGRVGGFRYLMKEGADYTSAHHDHFPLLTGPSHAVLLSGAPPYKSGVVDNEWYDRVLTRPRYCVEDPDSPLVGVSGPRTGISPATLRVTTVGDELEMATGGAAKVWGLALKDRAAVLMGGHLVDGALWFDEESGTWISSLYYCPEGSLPGWVLDWNRRKLLDAAFGTSWTLSVPPSALHRLWTPGDEHAANPSGLGTKFPHRIDGGLMAPGKEFYRAFVTTPLGNQHVLDTARELIDREGLGKDETPDLLAINLSTNDYIGHAYGPDSPEVLDASVQTDRHLSEFFNHLGRTVRGGLGSVTILVTADHGVAPNVGAMKEAGFDAGNYDEETLRNAAEDALDAAYGEAGWMAPFEGSGLYIDADTPAAMGIEPERAEEVAAAALTRMPGVYAVYTRSQILRGWMPRTEIAERVSRSFHPQVSGDLIIVAAPFWTPAGPKGSTHGSLYVYDTQVPLLISGAGIRPGRHARRVSTLDIAPTLCEILGILPPSGCEGRVLDEALK